MILPTICNYYIQCFGHTRIFRQFDSFIVAMMLTVSSLQAFLIKSPVLNTYIFFHLGLEIFWEEFAHSMCVLCVCNIKCSIDNQVINSIMFVCFSCIYIYSVFNITNEVVLLVLEFNSNKSEGTAPYHVLYYKYQNLLFIITRLNFVR